MKKPLCVTTFVFGDYQEYIPIFVYFVLRAYPDYYPLIFMQGALDARVRQRLELLRGLGRFRVQDNFQTALHWVGHRAKAVRWLLYDGEFADYDAVYSGDIDMLIMPENPKLHEQHDIHCEVLGLPYSNIIRPPRVVRIKKDPLSIAKRLVQYGVRDTLRALPLYETRVSQLSGLHYMRTDAYFRAVLPKMLEFMGLLGGGRGKTVLPMDKYLNGFRNEAFLLDLISDSGLGLPPPVEYGPDLLDYRNFSKPGFRPHHGIHLGIFRNWNHNLADRSMLRLDCYREYYAHYTLAIKSDPLFQALLKASPTWLQDMFVCMESGFESAATDHCFTNKATMAP
jgi:hypothetical protein